MAEAPGPAPPEDRPGPFPAALELLPAGPVALRLAAPASKSVTNRALLCAALADGASRLDGAAPSDDAEAMAAALTLLGARVDASSWTVTGTGGRLASPTRPLDARLSGTTMRFLAAAATMTPGGATVTGAPPLLRRPGRRVHGRPVRPPDAAGRHRRARLPAVARGRGRRLRGRQPLP
ncbi:MAG TPA: hypothetical protein VFO47_06250, partial [Actinomycetes bacterium]|nr:hypothetical protein [Actinomycetes bacterium]